MPENTWTDTDHIAEMWRPLTTAEEQRAPGLIAFVERAIRRTWRDVPARLADRTLDIDDVRDVVAWVVIPILEPGVDLPSNVKSWQETSGSESRSVVLGSSVTANLLEFSGWMVDVFEGVGRGGTRARYGPTPSGSFPEAGRYERLFPGWPEEAVNRGSAH
jgi:hypothetical protein